MQCMTLNTISLLLHATVKRFWHILRQNACMSLWPYMMSYARRRCRSSVTKCGSRISPEFFDLASPNFARTSILTCSTLVLVTIYFRSEVIAKKPAKMMALGGISWERFVWGPSDFKGILGTIGPTKLPDMPSLATSGQLQKAIKYCTKVRKLGLPG